MNVELAYTPPLAWGDLLAFLGGRGAAGVESADGGSYRRTVRVLDTRGWLSVDVAPGSTDRLRVQVSPELEAHHPTLLARLHDLLDLRADPAAVDAALGADRLLRVIVATVPGLRVPGAFDGFELTLRAILGQQVTVRAATTLFGRFAARFGERLQTPFPTLTHLSPTAALIAGARLQTLIDLGLTERRARTVRAVAREVADGRLRFEPGPDVAAQLERFEAIPGIGPWTSAYVAMRALRDADAFPHGDLALCKALGEVKPRQAQAIAERWRPYRAYAALYLWKRLSLDAAGRQSGG